MKLKRVVLPLVVILLALFLSACGAVTTTQNFPGLTLQDETVYLSEGLHVYGVNVVSGQEVRLGDKPLRFPAETDGNINLFAPVALTSDGQMIFPNSHPSAHSLYSVDPGTGGVRWAFEKSKGTWIAGSITIGDTIVAPGGDGILYALDTNGNTLWMLELSKNGLWARPASDGTLIFQPTLDGRLVAVNANSGTEAWSVALDSPILGSPVLDNQGNLFVGTLSGFVYQIQSANGNLGWKQQLQGFIWAAPVLHEDRIYMGTVNGKEGQFYALQKDTGSILWQRPETGSIIASPVVSADQVVYVTETGRVQSLTHENAPRWQADLKGKLVATPVLAGDLILIAPLGGDALLFAYDLNGVQRWTFQPEN